MAPELFVFVLFFPLSITLIYIVSLHLDENECLTALDSTVFISEKKLNNTPNKLQCQTAVSHLLCLLLIWGYKYKYNFL